jgi:uncharacterized protein YceH (UPF0502 family)
MASAPMMFDTYAFSQRLKGAGFTEAQVDAMTTGLSDIAMAQVANKGDIAAVRADLDAAVKSLRAEMREMEHRLTIKMGVIGTTLAGLIIAAQKLI